MSEQPTTPAVPAPAPAPTEAPAAPAAPAPAPAPTEPPAAPQAPAQPQPEGDGKVEDLPAWAQKLISDARADAGKARTNAKQQAADDARAELAQTIGKALGIVKDDQQAPPNPDELAQQVAAAQQAQRQAAVELAVYRAAGTHQGDPAALLDSRSFLAKVADLDPTGADFGTKVDEAIKSAVADNPKLKAVRAATASSVDHAGGSGEQRTRTPLPLDQAVRASYGA